jgi:hypothetical protein
MRIVLLSLLFVVSTCTYAQTLIANYNFYQSSLANQNGTTGITFSNITSNLAVLNFTSTNITAGSNSLVGFIEAIPSKSLNISSGNPGTQIKFDFTGTGLQNAFGYKIYFQAMNSGTGATTLALSYSRDGVNYSTISSNSITSTVGEYLYDLSSISSINNLKSTDKIYFKIELSGTTGGTGSTIIDNIQIQCCQINNQVGSSLSGYQWDTKGNSFPIGVPLDATNFIPSIGTKSNSTFTLKTNNTDRVHFLANGAIGIAKSNPSTTYKLDIGGFINATDFYKNGIVMVSSQWASNGLNIGYTSGSVGIGTTTPGASYKLDVAGALNATTLFQNGLAVVSSQWINNGTKIGYTAGSVGIGNTNPNTLYKLDVTGALNATTLYQSGTAVVSSQWVTNGTKIGYTAGSVGIGNSNPNTLYKLDVTGSLNATTLYQNGSAVVSSQWVTNAGNLNYTTGGVSIGTGTLSAGNKLSVLGNTDVSGNLSIGKSSATSKLEIKGNAADDVAFRIYNSSDVENFKVKSNGFVYAREVQVHPDGTAFPDYVFETNYSLMSLNDLENYINANKHLPNIPSALEVGVSGFGVAEMQIKQMEKIEELTLYIIEQNKKLSKLEEELKVLKTQQSK